MLLASGRGHARFAETDIVIRRGQRPAATAAKGRVVVPLAAHVVGRGIAGRGTRRRRHVIPLSARDGA